MKRSTEIDILMGNRPLPPDPNPSRPQRTFEDGIKEGYQKGLTEGYNNGFRDGKAKVPVPLKPARPSIKLLAILCALVFVSGAAISGFLSAKISFNKGTDNGIHIAKSTYEPQIEALNSQHKTEIERAKADSYDAGYREGLKVTPMPSDPPSPTPSVMPDAPAETTLPTIIQLDFPYSKARHGGTFNEVVRAIQSRLKELGYKEVGKVDGDYGDNTTAAVKKFQRKEKLVLDESKEKIGEVGPVTYLALFPETAISSNKVEQSNNNEEDAPPSATVTPGTNQLPETAQPAATTPSPSEATVTPGTNQLPETAQPIAATPSPSEVTVTPGPYSPEAQTENDDGTKENAIPEEDEEAEDENIVVDRKETVLTQL